MTEPSPFVSMRLTGDRFSQSGMPVEVLPELAAYRDLVLTVARRLYLNDHPRRQRVPRGFNDSFQLRLDRVEKGSVVPVLDRVSGDQGAALNVDDYFDRSRDAVQRAILEAASHGTLPSDFPRETLPEFTKFGRTLRPGEFIEIQSPQLDRPARYSAAVRRIISKAKSRAYLEDSAILGVVSEINSDRESFLLRTDSGLVNCIFPIDLFDTIYRYLRQPEQDGERVAVEGLISFSPQGNALAIPLVTGIYQVDEEDDSELSVLVGSAKMIDTVPSADPSYLETVQRLNELEALEAGWLDGDGEQISDVASSFVREVVRDLPRASLERMRIYPTETGALRLEWGLWTTEFSFEFRGDRTAVYDEVDVETGSETERELSFEEREDIVVLLIGG